MRVAALWRSPVKSMQGEQVASTEVGPSGLVGDRQWGVVDLATGRVLTARREPRLLFASARLVGDGVEVTLPDGSVAASDDALSEWLGAPVALRRASTDERATYETPLGFENEDEVPWVEWRGPKGSFHDSSRTMVSVATASSMRDWEPRRFRINVIIEGDSEPAVGSSVRIGDVVLEVAKPIDRCVVVTRPQPGAIDRDLDVLRTINASSGGNLGVGCLVTAPGPIAAGDIVQLL
jgi:uncharacterized protein YcbX